MVALCWKKSAIKMVNDLDLVGDNNDFGMQRISAFVSSIVNTNATSSSSAIVLSAVFSLASSAYSSLVLSSSGETTSTSNLPPLAFLQPYISTTVEALLPITTPPTLQLSNDTNPFYYSPPRTADANNHFISEVQQHQRISDSKKKKKSNSKEKEATSSPMMISDEKVDLLTFLLTSPVMSPSALETMRMMFLLGFCTLAETLLFLVAIVALMTTSSSSSSSSTSRNKKKSLEKTTTTTNISSDNNNNSSSTVVVSRPLSATAIARSVLIAQCARLAYLPFFIWSIPLDLLPLIEFTQILWYYLASGALTIEDDRIRRWLCVIVMLFLRSMFRIVTQWAPIVGWF